jgi:hypothetical protein
VPRFDQRCVQCQWEGEVFAQPYEMPPCPDCGGSTERVWRRCAEVRDDTFVGGLTLENLGDEPVTVFSRSELKRELHARNLEPFVRHVPVPGTDKSPHTTNWAVPSQYTLDAAKAILERVGAQIGRPSVAPTHVYPLATPSLAKEIAESWPR